MRDDLSLGHGGKPHPLFQMDAHTSDHGSTEAEKSTFRWIHLPDNDMSWAADVLRNVRRHSDAGKLPQDFPLSSTVEVDSGFYTSKFFQEHASSYKDGPFHARFMRPYCAQWKDNDTPTRIETVYMMPYLHWEKKESYQKMTRLAQAAKGSKPARDQDPYINSFLRRLQANTLQIRRSLDQSYYPSLPDTEHRDNDQVVDRYNTQKAQRDLLSAMYSATVKSDRREVVRKLLATKVPAAKTPRPLLMVDQLWLWLLNEGSAQSTVVTCFPQMWLSKDGFGDDLDVFHDLASFVRDEKKQCTTSKRLALLIIDRCAGNILDPAIATKSSDHNFIEHFDRYVDLLMDDQKACVERLDEAIEESDESNTKGPYDGLPKAADARLHYIDARWSQDNIAAEFNVLKDIRDIAEELHMMLAIVKKQREAINHLHHVYKHEEGDDDVNSMHFIGFPYVLSDMRSWRTSVVGMEQRTEPDVDADFEDHSPISRTYHRRGTLEVPAGKRPAFSSASSPRVQAADLMQPFSRNEARPSNIIKLIDRIIKRENDLKDLYYKAGRVEKSITRLLELKQQQANIAEVRSSRKIAEAADKQSQSVMLFTIVTIVFLPLTAVASIYGMNAKEFGQGNVHLLHIFRIMFPVSAGVALGILYLAFHTRVRRIVGLIFAIPWAYLMLKLPSAPLSSIEKAMSDKHNVVKEQRGAMDEKGKTALTQPAHDQCNADGPVAPHAITTVSEGKKVGSVGNTWYHQNSLA